MIVQVRPSDLDTIIMRHAIERQQARIAELEKDAERYDAIREEYDQGILIVMHPDPRWGQLISEDTALDEFADWLIDEFSAGEALGEEMTRLDAIDAALEAK
jgi:hypothetical protein